jgi:hypothetical protein
LLHRVEDLYDKRVVIEDLIGDPNPGRSTIADDGTPVLRLRPGRGYTPDIIVHELYHLIQHAHGFPSIRWQFPAVMDSPSNRSAFENVLAQLYAPMLHAAFYPTARQETGVDPGAWLLETTRETVRSPPKAEMAQWTSPQLALKLMRLKLELTDAVLVDQASSLLLETPSGPAARELGSRLMTIIQSANLSVPSESVQAFVRCLNVVYEREFLFTERDWTERLLGSHLRRLAVIAVEPIQPGR